MVIDAGGGTNQDGPPTDTNTNWFFGGIAGTAYADEGTTPLASTAVTLLVNGIQTQTTVTDATGRFTFSPDEYSQNDILTLYLDTDGGARGVTVTVAGAGDITDLDVYQNRLITRHDNVGSLTNTQLNTADDSGDTDISAIYSVDGSDNLTMGSGKELFVWSGNTFAPGADVTTTLLDIRGAYTHGAETLTVNGDYTHSQGEFSGGSGTFDVNGNFTITGGTFTAPSGTLAVSQNFTQTGSPTWDANGGTVSFDGSVAGNFSVNAPDVTFNVVAINRSLSSYTHRTFTIASGTTIPLGDSPTLNLRNNALGTYNANLTNNGTITTTSSGTWTAQRGRHLYKQRNDHRRRHHGVDHERQLHEQQHREHGQCVDDRCEQLQ